MTVLNQTQVVKQEGHYDLDGVPNPNGSDLKLKRQENGQQKVIDMGGKKALADAISEHLANTYSLYLKTQYFHWNDLHY